MPIEFRDDLPYDPTDKKSVIAYAGALVGHTLREATDAGSIEVPKVRRGAFGDSVEYSYFGIEPNSVQGPDFPEAGLELKTTPLKMTKSGKLAAKERLVITMIDYMSVVDEEFETSTLVDKARDILLVTYLYERDKDPLDYVVELATEWGLPEEDMPVFKEDWETVVGKVRAGKAHEISGSDTLYLEACTKASDSSIRRKQPFSDVPAKQRGRDFAIILSCLAEEGYSVEWRVINAAEYGMPQKRRAQALAFIAWRAIASACARLSSPISAGSGRSA
ncbi:MAG: MutH/Sau3AI family endonuclease [Eggerthellaceae bacterium]